MAIFQNYEVLGTIFLLIMVYLTFMSYKRKHLTKFTAWFWIIIWILGFLALIFKNSLQILLPSLAVYRIFDLYTIIGFMFFLFMIFYLFRIVKNTEKRLEELTRQLALRETNIHNPVNNNKQINPSQIKSKKEKNEG